MTPEHLADAEAHPATKYARAMLDELGIDCHSDSTEATPARFVKALLELTYGLHVDPTRHLRVTFEPASDDPGMIIARDVPFVSVCEHHLLLFTGTATVAYLPKPGARIVGLSKLARVAQEYGARPQVQERLGDQIVSALTDHLDTLGAACIIRSAHSCMTCRGARATGAAMVTSHLRGVFREKHEARAELMMLAG